MLGLSFSLIQLLMDVMVAGMSLILVLGIFSFVASILCSAAFLHNSKNVS
ncbi:uncharacterized protein LOC109840266 [Asparagus officinalis]|nr:uncharacterized protein LOC109840266 [Asparagus officinalis]